METIELVNNKYILTCQQSASLNLLSPHSSQMSRLMLQKDKFFYKPTVEKH